MHCNNGCPSRLNATLYLHCLSCYSLFKVYILITQSMDQSPSSEANRSSASQEIPRVLWNLMVNNRFCRIPPTVPIVSQINSVYASLPLPPPSHFLKIHLQIIFPSTPGSSKCCLSLRLTHQVPVCTSPFPIHATYSALLILFDFIIPVKFGEEYSAVNFRYVIFSTRQ